MALLGEHEYRPALDALEMGIWQRQRTGRSILGLVVHHSDAGSQYTSIRYTERLAEAGARPSIGSVGDSTTTRWPSRSSACSRPR